MPIAFAYQMMTPKEDGFRNAKEMYKKAIRRSECPLGAFNMLLSLYLQSARNKSPAESTKYLKAKLESLKRQF